MIIKLNTAFTDTFNVWDASANPVTGLVQGNFTVKIINPAGTEVSGTATWSIVERQDGLYAFILTPTTEGNWSVKITHATYLPTGLLAVYQVDDSSYDSIEDKLDIIDFVVDNNYIILDTMEADLKTYMDTKTTAISGYVADVGITVDEIFIDTDTVIPSLITSKHATTDGLITTETTQTESIISGYITGSQVVISGYIEEIDVDLSAVNSQIISSHSTTDNLVTTETTAVETYVSGMIATTDNLIESSHGTTDALVTSEVTAAEALISGYHVDTKADISGYIVDAESSIRGGTDSLGSLSSEITILRNSVRIDFSTPPEMGKPDTDTKTYMLILELFDGNGLLEIPDETPTLQVAEVDGTEVLAEASFLQFPSGQYYYNYTISNATDELPLIFTAKVVENLDTKYVKRLIEIKPSTTLDDIGDDISDINDNLTDLSNGLDRALGLMQENQKIVTLTKTATGKMLTGVKYLYAGNDFDVDSITYTYDITCVYDNNDQCVDFRSTMRD